MPIRGIALALMLIATAQLYAQTQADNEIIAVVGKDNHTLSYALQQSVVAEAGQNGESEAEMLKKLAANTLEISITDVTAGNFVQILDRPVSDFVTVPNEGQDILFIDAKPDATTPEAIYAHWGPITHQLPATKTINELMGDSVGVVTKYVATTVSVTFQGRSMTYRSIHFFGKGNQVLLVGDVMVEATRYSSFKDEFVPDMLLHSGRRNNPIVQKWLRSHTVDDPSCKQDELCCIENRCGLRSADLEKKLNEPIQNSGVPTPPQPFGIQFFTANAIVDTPVHEAFQRSRRRSPQAGTRDTTLRHPAV
jgi:hypothetical protein